MVNSREKTRVATRRKGRDSKPAAIIESFASSSKSPVETVLSPECAYRKMQHQSNYFHLGQKINQMLFNSPAPETLLPELSGALVEAFQVDYCLIAIAAGKQAPVQTAYWYPHNFQPILHQGLNPRLEHLVKAAMLTSSEPLEIADIEAVEGESLSLGDWESLPIGSVLGMTTQFQGHVNGVIMMMRSHPYNWTSLETEQLKAVSDSIAMAISQFQLQRQVREGVQYQALLNHLTRAIRSSTELDQILKLAIDGTARTLQVDRGLILLLKYTDSPFNHHPNQRIPKAKVNVVCEWLPVEQPQSNQNLGTLLNQSFWLSDCLLCQQTLKHAPQPTVIADQRRCVDDSPSGITSIFDPNLMPALLLVPLESKDTVLGFLVLQQRQPRLWLQEELELVELVSAQLSVAILQSQMQRQILALVEERTTQLKSSLAVQAKLYEKTRQQVDQLRQLNQLKDDFIDTVSHELKTPLTKMRMAIQNLRRPALSPDKQAQYLDILEQQCSQEINLIQDLLALQKLESNKSPIQLQKVDLKQLIPLLAQSFDEKWADKGLTLVTDLPERSLMLQTDPDSLSRILEELLTNAGKYSDPETTVHLSIAYQVDRESPQIVLTLSNTGPGIPPAEQIHIFEKFRRGQGVTQQAIAGTGLGLALVKCLVHHLNGTIAVSSNPSNQSEDAWETCFTLSLPQMPG